MLGDSNVFCLIENTPYPDYSSVEPIRTTTSHIDCKRTRTLSNGPYSGDPRAHNEQFVRGHPQVVIIRDGGIHAALVGATGLADEPRGSISETQPPTYTRF